MALLLKMIAYTEACGKGMFSLAGSEPRRDLFRLDALYKPEQVLEPLAGLLETRKATFHGGTSKAESVGLTDLPEKAAGVPAVQSDGLGDLLPRLHR